MRAHELLDDGESDAEDLPVMTHEPSSGVFEIVGLATDGRTALRLARENLLRRTQAADLD